MDPNSVLVCGDSLAGLMQLFVTLSRTLNTLV